MRSFFGVVALGAVSAGCAVGQKIDYADVTPGLVAHASIALGLAVQDRRPEVLSGEKSGVYVGALRAGFGNRWDLETQSGRPLADDMAGVIGRALAARGYQVTAAAAPTPDVPGAIVARAGRVGAARVLEVQIGAWNSDTYMGTKLTYDVTARVLEVPSGRLLGVARVAAARDLGASFWDPGSHAKQAIPPAYAGAIQALLDAAPIVAALGDAPPPPPPAPAPGRS